MSGKNSGNKRPWRIPILVVIVIVSRIVMLAWLNQSRPSTSHSGLSNSTPVHSSVPSHVDLTGRWSCDDGGTYYIQQFGEKVFWLGEGQVGGERWSNTFNGQISGDEIKGSWTDVEVRHGLANSSEMDIKIESPHRLVAEFKGGYFSGSVWKR